MENDWYASAARAALKDSEDGVERMLRMAYWRGVRDCIERIEKCDGPLNSFYISHIVDLAR